MGKRVGVAKFIATLDCQPGESVVVEERCEPLAHVLGTGHDGLLCAWDADALATAV
jgi:hypothetical protein